MTPTLPIRVAAKFFVSPDPGRKPELTSFIGLFHRFIQEARVEGLLIDVADYTHVPDGPGVILIGHDVDYGLDLTGGRAGLLTTSKRMGDLPVDAAVRDTLRRALVAIRAIEEDGSTGFRFDAGSVTLHFIDRLHAPNGDEAFEAARAQVAAVAEKLYADGFDIERAHADDPRKALAITVRAKGSVDAATLVQRLGAS